jgi:ABC-2 type transport system ATP-binding protein
MIALELANAVKRYGARSALAGVSLRLAPGEALGLLGPNGAGKTTALRLALGFARPSAGGVSLFGRDPRDPAAREGVGYLPERLVLPERASVRGFLRLQAALAGLTGAARDREVEDALAAVGLAERVREHIGGLSKGLRQRLGFANALLGRPRLVILDEPTTGLDPLGMRDARGWIQAARERGSALLVSSHTLSEVERLCDRIAILNEGRLAASGALAELAAPGESLEDVFVRVVRG